MCPVEQPMKKMGRQMRMENTSTTTAKRGMARREKEKRFMMIPPRSIPSAAAGRFTAPAGERSHQGGPACPEPLHGQGAALWASQELGEPTDPTVVQDSPNPRQLGNLRS